MDALAGAYVNLDQKAENLNLTAIVDTMFASFAFPGFFPPAKHQNSEFFDGSTCQALDVLTLVNNCMTQVESESDIVIDVIMTTPSSLKAVDASNYKSYEMLYRYLQVRSYYQSLNGLQRARFTHPNVTYRHVISPTQSLPYNFIPMSQNLTETYKIMAQGVADGANSIEKGLTNIDDHIDYYRLKKANDPSIKNVAFEEFVTLKRQETKNIDAAESFLSASQ